MSGHVRFVLLGDTGIGKTSFLSTFLAGRFPESNDDFQRVQISSSRRVEGRDIEFDFYDAMDGEDVEDKMRPQLRAISFKDSAVKVFVICFAIDSRKSFESVATKWIPELRSVEPNTPIYLLGLRSDLRSAKSESLAGSVTGVEATEFVEANQSKNVVGYGEASAKTDLDSVKARVDEILLVGSHSGESSSRCVIS